MTHEEPGPGVPNDPERDAADNPRTPPHTLADLASRRWDLHAIIAANPGAYPELRHWIARVSPNSVQQRPTFPVRATSTGSAHVGWWVGGCGCLALAGLFVTMIVVLGAVGAKTSSGGHDPGPDGVTASPQQGSGDPVLDGYLTDLESDREKYHALAARLDGNPAAPLVTQPVRFQQLEKRLKDWSPTRWSAEAKARDARRYRSELQQLAAVARKRRGNRSGTVAEGLIDRAGKGFIDVRWDAASACRASKRENWKTTGCVTKDDALTIHLVPARSLSNWEERMLATHELAHVYQRADRARFLEHRGHYDRLLKRGLFQGSAEKMADCYALTYNNQRSLSKGNVEMGYGYVCSKSERTAIRRWAADVNAPMPR